MDWSKALSNFGQGAQDSFNQAMSGGRGGSGGSGTTPGAIPKILGAMKKRRPYKTDYDPSDQLDQQTESDNDYQNKYGY